MPIFTIRLNKSNFIHYIIKIDICKTLEIIIILINNLISIIKFQNKMIIIYYFWKY